jgi:hypothetical protein
MYPNGSALEGGATSWPEPPAGGDGEETPVDGEGLFLDASDPVPEANEPLLDSDSVETSRATWSDAGARLILRRAAGLGLSDESEGKAGPERKVATADAGLYVRKSASSCRRRFPLLGADSSATRIPALLFPLLPAGAISRRLVYVPFF